MSWVKKYIAPAKDILSFISLAVGLFLTFRDKFQKLSFVSEIAKIPFLGSILVLLLGIIPVIVGVILIRRKKLSSLINGYKIPYYSPQTRKLAKGFLYTYFGILPLLGLSLIATEFYRQALSFDPLQASFVQKQSFVDLQIA